MELYIDESGNTGNVITKDEKFNFEGQRHFVLCAVKVTNDNEKSILIQKYKEFKKKFNIQGEIKGSDLMTREHNTELEYFVQNILDDKHFEICIYDKKFYLSTLLLLLILGNEFQSMFPVQFYVLAAEISFHCENLIKEYCELVKKPTAESFKHFLEIVLESSYGEIPTENNPIKMMAEAILEDGNFHLWLNDLLSYGSYENPNYINVINLNCLSELIIALKWQNNITNSELKIHHDKIDGYDKTFISELKSTNIELNFVDSKKEELIQIADNAVGIFSKCVNEVTARFDMKKEWQPESLWIMEQYSKILDIVDINNIKFTIPIPNWAVSLCVRDMFNKNYPPANRCNLYFNQYYMQYMQRIMEDLSQKDFTTKSTIQLLNK